VYTVCVAVSGEHRAGVGNLIGAPFPYSLDAESKRTRRMSLLRLVRSTWSSSMMTIWFAMEIARALKTCRPKSGPAPTVEGDPEA
jgi:hypothetical protein